jgi:hypothetical protein
MATSYERHPIVLATRSSASVLSHPCSSWLTSWAKLTQYVLTDFLDISKKQARDQIDLITAFSSRAGSLASVTNLPRTI